MKVYICVFLLNREQIKIHRSVCAKLQIIAMNIVFNIQSLLNDSLCILLTATKNIKEA